MHDDIRKFSLEGELGGANVLSTKDRLVHFIENVMRDSGYVPLLDMDPQFSRDYNPETNTFNFLLSVYGVAIKGGNAWQTSGVMGGKAIPRHMVSANSKTFSTPAI